jgi:hypothetical protein
MTPLLLILAAAVTWTVSGPMPQLNRPIQHRTNTQPA